MIQPGKKKSAKNLLTFLSHLGFCCQHPLQGTELCLNFLLRQRPLIIPQLYLHVNTLWTTLDFFYISENFGLKNLTLVITVLPGSNTQHDGHITGDFAARRNTRFYTSMFVENHRSRPFEEQKCPDTYNN